MPSSNYNRRRVNNKLTDTQYWGRVSAQVNGDHNEGLADRSFDVYQQLGLLTWLKTGPQIKFISEYEWFPLPGAAPPDRHATVHRGGRALWAEIKTWKDKKDKVTLRDRLHQFESLVRFHQMNAIAFYLVNWRHPLISEWRIHPIPTIEVLRDGKGKYGYGIVLHRNRGILVRQNAFGVPDWYDEMVGQFYGQNE